MWDMNSWAKIPMIPPHEYAHFQTLAMNEPLSRPLMQTPRSVDIEITAKCNLRCRYCYYFDNPAVEYADISAEQWLSFFEELGRCAVLRVTLQGGEPFTREDLPRLMAGIVENRMRFSILSNGSLIDDETAQFIAETGRCDAVQISLDGHDEKTHDAFRGKGAFAGAVRGIEILRSRQIPVAVRVTIHRKNVDALENIARFLLEEMKFSGFSTNSAGALGACRRHEDEILLSTAERKRGMETLLELQQRYPDRISGTAGPLAEALMWQEMTQARHRNAPPFPEGGYLTGCGCAWQSIAVRADGAYIPCAMLPQQVMGRINRDPLEKIWKESPILQELRDRRAISLTRFSHCRDCPYIPYCTGNCPGLAYSLTRTTDHPSPDACLRRYIEEGGELPNMPEEILSEAPRIIPEEITG